MGTANALEKRVILISKSDGGYKCAGLTTRLGHGWVRAGMAFAVWVGHSATAMHSAMPISWFADTMRMLEVMNTRVTSGNHQLKRVWIRE